MTADACGPENAIAGTALYVPRTHPHRHKRHADGPHLTTQQHGSGFSAWLAVRITSALATMTCAALFALLALVALPQAVESHSILVLVAWISQTFIQLTALSILAVGQRVLSAASDKRAVQMFDDVTLLLHEHAEIQQHLTEQSTLLMRLADHLGLAPTEEPHGRQ